MLCVAAPGIGGERPVLAQAERVSNVSTVVLSGLLNVPEQTVRPLLSLKPGEPYTAAKLAADRKALLDTGYFRRIQADARPVAGQTQVTFTLVEWPLVSHIRILGSTLVPLRDLYGALTTQVGQVLRSIQLQNDIRAIERLYRERGYVARVSERILDEAAKSGILRFEILELKIDGLDLEGGTPEQRERVRAELTEKPGNFYRPLAVGMDQQRVLQVRGVKSAIARVEPSGPGKVRIRWLLNPPPDTRQPAVPE